MKLLFHSCCAPCTAASVESLCKEGITPTLFWFNPNIHPVAEYQNRRDALLAIAGLKNLPVETIDEYGLYSFTKEVGSEIEFGKRCRVCYHIRLERVASRPAELGFDAFSTTL